MAHGTLHHALTNLCRTARRHVPFTLFGLLTLSGAGWITAQLVQITT